MLLINANQVRNCSARIKTLVSCKEYTFLHISNNLWIFHAEISREQKSETKSPPPFWAMYDSFGSICPDLAFHLILGNLCTDA